MSQEGGETSGLDDALYQGALAEKHHYDNLSWTIGAIALIGAGVLVVGVMQVPGATYLARLPSQLALATLAVILLEGWRRIYERNRFWAEVANEKLRDLERARGVEGVTLSFMKAALTGQVVLQNLDHTGAPFRDPYVERCSQHSMHVNINRVLWFVMVVVVIFALLPHSPKQ